MPPLPSLLYELILAVSLRIVDFLAETVEHMRGVSCQHCANQYDQNVGANVAPRHQTRDLLHKLGMARLEEHKHQCWGQSHRQYDACRLVPAMRNKYPVNDHE